MREHSGLVMKVDMAFWNRSDRTIECSVLEVWSLKIIH